MCPRRRGRDLTEVIKKTIEDEVQDTLERKELEKEVLSESTETSEKVTKEEEATLQKMIASFPSSQGYYGKLYKTLPSGNTEMKYYFPSLEDLQDPEVEVANLAKARRWGSGSYKLRVYRHGSTGVQRSLTLTIDAEPDPGTETPITQAPPERIGDQLRNVVELVNTARELAPQSSNMGDPTKMGQVLAETFKAGVEAVKFAMPSPSNSPPKVSEEDVLLRVLTKLQEVGVIGVPEEKDSMKSLLETVGVLKQLGLIGREEKKDDFWEQLTKLKAAGLVKMAGEEDTFSSVEKLKSLIDLVTPLINPGGVDKVTFAVEAVRVIGPHVPKIIENITSAVKEVADVSRMRIESSMGIAPTRKELPAPEIKAPEYRRPVPLEVRTSGEGEIPSASERPRSPNPIVDEILEAAYKKDLSYFPKLQEMLIIFVGPHVVEALASGQVSSSTFMSMTSSYGQGIFNTKEAREYLDLFVNWVRGSVEAFVPGKIVGKCSKCGAIFDFEDEETFGDPSNQVCDTCGGLVERVKEEIVPTPLS